MFSFTLYNREFCDKLCYAVNKVNVGKCVMIKIKEKETNILGLLVCQYELEDADTRPPLAFPVVGAWVQFLQCIKRFGCIVELAHLKQ